MMQSDVQKFAQFAEQTLNLREAALSDAYYYQSLPLCVVDAIFSLGVRYRQVENVVSVMCEAAGWKAHRNPSSDAPTLREQKTVSDFLDLHEQHPCAMDTLFKNRGFANPGAMMTNRIRKADLVRMFAEKLKENRIESFQDLQDCPDPGNLEHCLLSLPALNSGVAVRYFWMLAGDEDEVKPDRMIHRFIHGALKRSISNDEAVELIRGASIILRGDYPALNPRLLDHEIWKHQRKQRVRL